MRRRAGALALLVATGLAAPARAEIYTWVDDQGTVHFEQTPPPGGKRARRVELPDPPPPPEPDAAAPAPPKAGEPAPRREPPPPAAAAPPRPRATPAVELFGTSWCPHCARAREFFRRKGIAVLDHDIDKDTAARRRKIELTGNTAVPTVVIGGTVIQGFRPAEFERALAP